MVLPNSFIATARAMWLEEGAPTVQRITIAKGVEDHDGTLEYQTWIAGSKLD